jgi:hypothetical protein
MGLLRADLYNSCAEYSFVILRTASFAGRRIYGVVGGIEAASSLHKSFGGASACL